MPQLERIFLFFSVISFIFLLLSTDAKKPQQILSTPQNEEAPPMPGQATLSNFSSYRNTPQEKPLDDLILWGEAAKREAESIEILIEQLHEQDEEEGDDYEDNEDEHQEKENHPHHHQEGGGKNPQQEEEGGKGQQQEEGGKDQQQQLEGHQPEEGVHVEEGAHQEEDDDQKDDDEQEGGDKQEQGRDLADAILRSADLAAEFQKMQIDRQLIRHDPELEIKANRLYQDYIYIVDFLTTISSSVLSSALSSPAGAALMPSLRTNGPVVVHWSRTIKGLEDLTDFLRSYQINEQDNVQQLLCIAQTDPEPEAREQAFQQLDMLSSQPEFRQAVVKKLRHVLKIREHEEKENFFKGLPAEENFFGDMATAKAANVAIEGGGCGLYKRMLRIRKHIFLRSKEGLLLPWLICCQN